MAVNLVAAGSTAAAPGDLDISFNGDGKVLKAPVSGLDSQANDVLTTDEGDVVTTGSTYGNQPQFSTAKFTLDGNPALLFGNGGHIATGVGNMGNDAAYALTELANGDLVLLGKAQVNSSDAMALVRMDSTGQLVDQFGSNGRQITTFGGTGSLGTDILALPDGDLLAVGRATFPPSGGGFSSTHFALARYNPDGYLDDAFGTNGTTTTSVGSGDSGAINSVALLPGWKKIVVAGTVVDGGKTKFALARYDLATGALDTTFGTGGKVLTTVGTGSFALARKIVVLPDGDLLVAGTVTENGVDKFALARYKADGSTDQNFGSGTGISIHQIGDSSRARTAIGLTENRIVLAGSSESSGQSRFALARFYTTTGALDPNFGNGGVVTTGIGDGSLNNIESIAAMQDGRLVGAGYANEGGYKQLALVRYHNELAPLPPPAGPPPTQQQTGGTDKSSSSSSSNGSQSQATAGASQAETVFKDNAAPTAQLVRKKPKCKKTRRLAKGKRICIKRAKASLAVKDWRSLKGTATDPLPSSGIAKVEINLVQTLIKKKKVKGKSRKVKVCYALKSSKVVKVPCKKVKQTWSSAKIKAVKNKPGAVTWSLTTKKGLKAGRYTLTVRAVDRAGNAQKKFKKNSSKFTLKLTKGKKAKAGKKAAGK